MCSPITVIFHELNNNKEWVIREQMKHIKFFFIILFSILLISCGGDDNTGSNDTDVGPGANTPPVATSNPIPVATEEPSPQETLSPGPVGNDAPAPVSTAIPVPGATAIPAPAATAIPVPAATDIPAPAATTNPSPINTTTPEPVATASPVPTPAIDGRVVFMEPQPNGNTFSCGVCHKLQESLPDQFDRPGHAVGDALRRSSYKNGLLPNFLDAVNTCLETWITVPAEELWTEETPEFVALQSFIEEQDEGTGDAPLLSFEKAEPLRFASNEAVNGDPDAGREHFNESCAICHGQGAVGTNRAPQLAGRYSFFGAANFIARKVRLSGPVDHDIYVGDSVRGVMPFWAIDRISNEDLEDVIAFIISTGNVDPDPEPTPEPTPPPIAPGCTSTHPKIGQTAELSTVAHNVMGTATIVDDCTIRLDNFSFDGGGIDIRVYGGNGEFFNTGFSMSENLFDMVFNNDTLTVTLPDGKTLDDLDRISIWCLPVRFSFGDGIFR